MRKAPRHPRWPQTTMARILAVVVTQLSKRSAADRHTRAHSAHSAHTAHTARSSVTGTEASIFKFKKNENTNTPRTPAGHTHLLTFPAQILSENGRDQGWRPARLRFIGESCGESRKTSRGELLFDGAQALGEARGRSSSVSESDDRQCATVQEIARQAEALAWRFEEANTPVKETARFIHPSLEAPRQRGRPAADLHAHRRATRPPPHLPPLAAKASRRRARPRRLRHSTDRQ